MLYADNAGIVPRSPAGLAIIMTVIVEVFGVFWLDRVGEEDRDYPDAGTRERAAAEGDTNTTSTGTGDRNSWSEVQPVRIPGRPHRRRRPHARYQPPHQNRLGMLQEVFHIALRQAKRAIKAQASVAEGGGHGGSTVRVHDVGSA